MSLPTSITTRLEYQHKSLMELIEDLSDEQIRAHVIPGKWSIFENIVHLTTYQHSFILRLRKLLSEENPQLTRYRAEDDPLFGENCQRSTREIMQNLITTRRELISNILTFKDHDLQRTGQHPVYGKMNLLQWINFFLLHEAHHLFTIFKLAAEVRSKQQ